MQNWGAVNLNPGQSRTFTVYLIAGTAYQVQSSVYTLEGR